MELVQEHRNGEGIPGPDTELRRQKSSGSVKRARERAAAGLPADGRDPLEPAPLRITPNRTPPRATTPNELIQLTPNQPGPSPSSSVSPLISQQKASLASSSTATPTTPPHWPAGISPTKENLASRGPPPKRPPRPEYVPPLPGQSSPQQSPNYWENNFGASTTNATRSPGRPGAGITTAGVPEFPIPFTPQTPHQPRRNLGPPPSARKGGANFYPQNAFVAPIPEEQSDAHSSFASSHVMPVSWGDGPPEFYNGSGIDEEDEDDVHSPSSTNDGRESRAGDHDESTGLVRKVSIGKPGKPALKSVKNQDGQGDDHLRTGQEVQFGPGAGVATFLAPSSNNNSPAATPRERAMDDEKDIDLSHSGTVSPTSPIDPRVAKILGGLEKGGALSTAGTTPLTSAHPSMSDRGKRPARLQLVKESHEQPRGSATSLPELIRRATRLASNLDRGRTASRIGMLEMLEKEKTRHPSRSGSISDILAAFPSPSLATPQGQSPRFPSPLARSGLHHGMSVTDHQSDFSKQTRSNGRRCCGLPIWAFILLCIILVLLIAAAVIIPITLIVLPRQNSNPPAGTVAACKKSFPCSNGGVSVLQAGSCRCICMNGFTGASCTSQADSGCTTTSIDGEDGSLYKNATMGTSIRRLFTSAESTYGIPLNPTVLLSAFSSQNITCTSENALVTFNGKPQRRRRSPYFDARDEPTKASEYLGRLVDRASPAQAAVTSNGLVYAAPSVPEQSSSTAIPSSSSSIPAKAAPTSTSKPSTSSTPLTPQILDFARTTVLFILQVKDLTTAVNVQEAIQTIFTPAASGSGMFDSGVEDVGGGVKVDWKRWTVDLGNGTVVGGKGLG